jgi:hypothetical protein
LHHRVPHAVQVLRQTGLLLHASIQLSPGELHTIDELLIHFSLRVIIANDRNPSQEKLAFVGLAQKEFEIMTGRNVTNRPTIVGCEAGLAVLNDMVC